MCTHESNIGIYLLIPIVVHNFLTFYRMQNVDVPYRSLEYTLRALKVQVIDSLPFIGNYIPDNIKSPEELFYYLRSITNYASDPKGVELIQTVQTLMDNDGEGDCDCFTVLTLASCYHCKFLPQYVALVGRSRRAPSHIYSEVFDYNKGKICAMDLTNPEYDYERSYPYKQRLIFNI